VFSLVERGGKVRSFHVPSVNAKNLKPILESQLKASKTHLMTDGGANIPQIFPDVCHASNCKP
jgi:hypothetical protein